MEFIPSILLNLVVTIYLNQPVSSLSYFNMKTILGIIFFLANYPALAQTTVLADVADDGCKIKVERIKVKIEDRRKKYEFNVQEYRKGLFCSECGRTKSEIEERAHLNFNEHIKEGAAHNRHTLIATQEIYDHLYVEYFTDFNNLKEEYDNEYADCGGDLSSANLQIITDQQLQFYTKKLNGDASLYNAEFGLLRIDYYFYYAWTIRINIIKWQTIRIHTIQFTKNSCRAGGTDTGNAISQAGNMLNDYLKTLADKQRTFFPGADPQPSRTLQNVFVNTQ